MALGCYIQSNSTVHIRTGKLRTQHWACLRNEEIRHLAGSQGSSTAYAPTCLGHAHMHASASFQRPVASCACRPIGKRPNRQLLVHRPVLAASRGHSDLAVTALGHSGTTGNSRRRRHHTGTEINPPRREWPPQHLQNPAGALAAGRHGNTLRFGLPDCRYGPG